MNNRKLVFENGREFYGCGFGAAVDAVNEIVFNTSMVGYQEILTDPAYTGQMVLMTYPLIGNYGMNDEDNEAKIPTMGGFIVREYNDEPSNFRYTKTLSEVMEESMIPGIAGVDTRAILRMMRKEKLEKVFITASDTPLDEALARLNAYTPEKAAMKRISCKKRWYSRTPNPIYNLVAIDCGMKLSVVRAFNKLHCTVTVLPYNTTAEEVLALAPDGVFLSGGPGDPREATEVVEVIQNLKGKLPIFAIGLGHQLVALAYGAKIEKLAFGHHGANLPVRNLATNALEITSQNHKYTVNEQSVVGTGLTVTHKNLLDGSVEGVMDENAGVFAVQYQAESAPGEHATQYFFAQFLQRMEKGMNGNA